MQQQNLLLQRLDKKKITKSITLKRFSSLIKNLTIALVSVKQYLCIISCHGKELLIGQLKRMRETLYFKEINDF